MSQGYDYTNEVRREIAVDKDGKLITKPEGVYLLVAPDLDDGDQHRLLLTQDGKLKVDDPTTQAAIADLITRAKGLDDIHDDVGVVGGLVLDVEDKLDHGTHGLAALETLIDELEARLVTGLQTGMTLSDHLLAGNFIRNPGFETGDTTGWGPSGAGSWSVQNVTVKHGTWAADLNPNALGAYRIHTTNRMPCYPGMRIRAEGFMKADANIAASRIIIYFIDAANVTVTTVNSRDWGGNYDWTYRRHIATAPPETVSVRVQFYFTSGAIAGHGYVDSTMLPRAPMDAEIHEAHVHVCEIFPDDTNKTCTVTSGGGANAWGAWANLVDSAAGTLSAKFAASDGYLEALHIEDLNSTDNLYMLELRDNVTGETIARLRFSKAGVLLDAGHAIDIHSPRIYEGADIEYRMKDATGGKTALLHVRYYLV